MNSCFSVPKKALSQGYEQYKGHILKSHLTKPITKNFYLWLFLITFDKVRMKSKNFIS